MSDLLILGMEMPTEDEEIIIRIDSSGTVMTEYALPISGTKAIPVPPHGRLIGADALWVEINKICDRRDAGIIADLTCVQQILSALRHTPTIIPAEGVET